MDNDRGFYFLNESENAFPIADIDFTMPIAWDDAAQEFEDPGSVTFGSEENFALVVVDTQHGIASLVKVEAHLGADQPA